MGHSQGRLAGSGGRGGEGHGAATNPASAGPVAPTLDGGPPGEEQEEWDVIIVGSGMGGLSAASTLAQTRGLRCLVVEQHWTPGGMTHQFEREGKYWFSTGMHYVSQLGPEAGIFPKIMRFVTKGMIWDKLPDEFEASLFPDGRSYRQPSDPAAWRAQLVAQFPGEAQAIEQYFRDIEAAYSWYRLHFFQQALGWPLSALCGWLGARGRARYEALTAQAYFDQRFRSEELKGVLLGMWGDYGLRPQHSTFLQHALTTRNNFGGCYHPRLGSRQVARSVTPIIEGAGGRVMVSTTVKEIVVEGGAAVGVRVEQAGRLDRFISARLGVMSACGAYLTFRRLLAQPLHPELESERLITAGYSTIALYVGLKGDPKELWGLRGETLRLNSTYAHAAMKLYDPEEGEVSHVIVCPTSQREHNPRAHCMDIFTFTSPDCYRRWEGTQWMERGDEYERVKAKIAADVLAFISRWLPGYAEQVEFVEVGTPLTWQKFTAWKDGTIYGVPATGDKLRCTHILRPPTPIKRLLLAGCDANVFGITGAMLGGVMAAGHLLHPRMGLVGMLPEINRAMAAPGWDNILALPPEAAAAALVETTDETPDTRTLTFQLPNVPGVAQRFAFEEGQYVTLVLDVHRSEVRRSYSLSSSPAQLPRLSITVKRLPGGMASTHLHSLEVGATVHVLPPAGDFTVQPLPSGGGVHLFFAAGSGIAPILPMLRAALARGEPAALLHCSRWRGEVIFGAQLAQLERDQQAGAGHLLAVQHCLSKEQPQVQVPAQDSSAAEPGKDEGMGKAQAAAVVVSLAADARRPAAAQPEWYGRLTERRVTAFLRDVLRRVVPGQQGSGGAADAVSVRCYMCGPVGWMETIRGALKAAGVPAAGIHAEDFAADGAPLAVDYAAAGVEAVPHSVQITTAAGSERMVTVAPHQSVLSAVLNAGVAVPYSCKNGSCKTCTATLCSGSVLDIEEGLVQAAGQRVLTCRIAPASDGVVLRV